MEKQKKTIFLIAGVLILLLAVFFIAKVIITNKIENQVGEVLGKSAEYEDLDVSLLQRKISLKKLNFSKAGKRLQAERISLSGISFYNYLINDKLHIDQFTVEQPQIILSGKDSTSGKGSQQNFNRNISIGEFKATNGTFILKDDDKKRNQIFLRFPEARFSEVSIDSTTLQQKIPFSYKGYRVKGDSIRLNLNPEHFIAAGKFHIDNGETSVKNFRIIPYYDIPEFNEKIPYEKDRISLRVDSLQLDSLNFGFKNDTLYLRNPKMTISNADLQVYRNKILPDDPSKRRLYSQQLRVSPVKLDFEKVILENSHIGYEEKAKDGRPPASVVFDIQKGEIENITNIDLERKDFPRTKVKVDATFQEVTPLSVDWSFNTSNLNDKFLFSGKFGTLPGDALNSLLRPSMNMEAKGKIQEAWFTFTGNEDVLTGDVRLKYDQFKFVWLEEDGSEKKGFFTAIANLFVDNNGISGENVSKDVMVQRDVHRSFWSYVWSGLKAGVRQTFSQF